ncbi:unnamed protein product [Periconia digitata]|uniref:Uncharacterized protein n=1 Tax=Periconia digitata TaxID=1303443 RepID=A0A9W4UA08_9PLEO|nr:unnamed protein product [Periconia digitata]
MTGYGYIPEHSCLSTRLCPPHVKALRPKCTNSVPAQTRIPRAFDVCMSQAKAQAGFLMRLFRPPGVAMSLTPTWTGGCHALHICENPPCTRYVTSFFRSPD